MQRESIFRSKDITVVEKYRAEDASRQVPDDKLVNLKPIWHLPHHSVWHPKKAEEPRVVFDCASRSGGYKENVSSGLCGTRGSWSPFFLCWPNGDIAKDPKTH